MNNFGISIKPAEASDSPGQIMYAARPLVKNIEGVVGWRVVSCSECHQDCWERPELESEGRKIYGDRVRFVCTECMVRAGVVKP